MKRIYGPFINLYLVVLIYFMFFGLGRTPDGYFEPQLHPFRSINYFFTSGCSFIRTFHNNINNIIVFIPFGFLGLLYPALKSYLKLVGVFIPGILLLEFLQWYSHLGMADIDDVLLNTLGMSIGFILFKIHEDRKEIYQTSLQIFENLDGYTLSPAFSKNHP